MEVVALVGGSGTGKSQRALVVAREINTNYIIDDGLFIRGSRIVAGKSAKAEATRIAAVRTAIFSEPEHADEVRQAIEEESPHRILVLATSDAMIDRIVESLDLPEPTSHLRIEDMAPKSEIEAALRARKDLGRHVIPAPSFEVKKTFRGWIMNSLRLLYQGARLRRPVIFEKSVVRPTFSSMGKFFISDQVLGEIAGYSLTQMQGVESVSPPVARRANGQVHISLSLVMNEPDDLVNRLRQVQSKIKESVEELTSVGVQAVDVHVVDIVFDAEELLVNCEQVKSGRVS